jgi:hypothetical protein
MPLLEVIDLDHHGKPLLARGLGAGFFVLEPGHMVHFEAGDPPINRRA